MDKNHRIKIKRFDSILGKAKNLKKQGGIGYISLGLTNSIYDPLISTQKISEDILFRLKNKN